MNSLAKLVEKDILNKKNKLIKKQNCSAVYPVWSLYDTGCLYWIDEAC